MSMTQELTQRDMNRVDRLSAFKLLIDKFLAQTPTLWDDPLYRAIIEQTGNVFQPLSSATKQSTLSMNASANLSVGRL